MTPQQIIEVGKALLPYLRNDLTDIELGTAAYNAVAALARLDKKSLGLSGPQRLAIACGNGPYEDDTVCPTCKGHGYT